MESHVNEVLAALRDPMGVPLYPVVFQLLMVLTFALHILFVNFVVGGLMVSLWGRLRRAERWQRLSATTARIATISVSFAVLIGVAPLLFVQVIYDPFWYASNLLSAAWVVGFIFLMIAAYSSSYRYYLRHHRGAARTAFWGLLALAGFLLAGFVIHALNYQALLPDAWLGWVSTAGGADTRGTTLHAWQWARYLHVILASPVLTGLLLVASAWYFRNRGDRDPEYLAWVAKFGLHLAFGFGVISVATGLWWSAVIPGKLGFHADPFYLVAIVLGVALVGYLWAVRRDPLRHAVPAGVAGLVVVLAMAAARESLRSDYVGQFGYSIFDYPVNVDWGSTALFFLTFLWGFIAIGYLLTVAYRSGRVEGEVDLSTTGVRTFGNVAIASLVAWIGVIVGLGVYITYQHVAPALAAAADTAAAPAAATATAAATAAADHPKAVICAGCHGPDGNSLTADNPTLAGQHRDYLIVATESYRDGRRTHAPMQALVAGLAGQDVMELAELYCRQPVKPIGYAEKLPGDPASAVTHSCAGCHGNRGESSSPTSPKLAALSGAYLTSALQAYRGGTRAHGLMRALAATRSEAEVAHLAAFYAVKAVKAPKE